MTPGSGWDTCGCSAVITGERGSIRILPEAPRRLGGRHLNLGLAHWKKGDGAVALKSFEKALFLEPKSCGRVARPGGAGDGAPGLRTGLHLQTS